MLISTKSIETVAQKLSSEREIFCSGLFLSARWFVVSQLDLDCMNVIVLPDRDSAEYCAADLYNLIEGDVVFFFPDSGKIRAYSTLAVQMRVPHAAQTRPKTSYRRSSACTKFYAHNTNSPPRRQTDAE